MSAVQLAANTMLSLSRTLIYSLKLALAKYQQRDINHMASTAYGRRRNIFVCAGIGGVKRVNVTPRSMTRIALHQHDIC